MTRQEANRRILKILAHYVEMAPDIRFCQLLYSQSIVEDEPTNSNVWIDEYYTESVDTLARMFDE